LAQVRQCGTTGADHAEHVHLEDPPPLVVVVVLYRADGADARVVDQDVDAAERLGGRADRGSHRGVVRHVSDEGVQRSGTPTALAVRGLASIAAAPAAPAARGPARLTASAAGIPVAPGCGGVRAQSGP